MLELLGIWLTKIASGVVLGIGKVVGNSGGQTAKKLVAERAASKNPEGGIRLEKRVLADALERLRAANPEDSLLKQLVNRVGGALVTPDYLNKPFIQNWLGKPEVREWFIAAASAKLLGGMNSLADLDVLIESFMQTSGEDRNHAESVVSAIISMMCDGTAASVSDPATAAIVVIAHKDLADKMEDGFARVITSIQTTPSLRRVHTVLADGAALDIETTQLWRTCIKKASAELLAWPSTLPNKETIARPELSEIIARIEQDARSAVAVLGAPGSGKSALLANLGQVLEANPEYIVFGIKADLLNDDLESEADLQRQFELPELPSVMLKALSSFGPVIVLVDQLDALASYLDVRTARLSVLLNMIRAIGKQDGIHIIVSCRQFEFDHDVRLRSIDTSNLTLALPEWPQVLTVLERFGVDARGWPQDACEMIRVPQHLNTFLLLAKNSPEPFVTYQGMLDKIWIDFVLAPLDGAQRSRLVYSLANRMAEKETLWLSPARFEEFQSQIAALVGAGLLMRNATGALGFSHQTVFEYVLARTFASEEASLSAYVLARQDSLFVRPKLWAALGYLRNTEITAYEEEVAKIWRSPGLRKHLRFLIIDFLALQPDPTDVEASLLFEATHDTTELRLVLRGVAGSKGWFERLSGGVIAESMADSARANETVRLLGSAWIFAPQRVIDLLKTYWIPDSTNDQRVLRVLEDATEWRPEAVALGRVLFGRINIDYSRIDYAISIIGFVNPVVAVEFLRIVLDRVLAAELSEDPAPAIQLEEIAERFPESRRKTERLLSDSYEWENVPGLAEANPRKFLETMWPWYLAVFHAHLGSAPTQGLGYPLQWKFDYRFEEEGAKLSPVPLMAALLAAVAKLAADEPEILLKWLQVNSTIELSPVQRLISFAYVCNSRFFAHEALAFLLNDVRRFCLGSFSDARITTKTLILECAQHWSTDELSTLAEGVWAYSPSRPPGWNADHQIRGFPRFVRRTKVELLKCLPKTGHSSKIKHELEETERIFPSDMPRLDIASGWIGSPMSEDQFAKASDDDIVNAFRQLPDATGWDHPRHPMKGGSVQLAQTFAAYLKTDLLRAPRLIARLEASFGQRAAGYAIEALAEDGDSETVEKLILDLNSLGFSNYEFRASVAQAIKALVSREIRISDKIVNMLEVWVADELDSRADEGAASDVDQLNPAFDLSGEAAELFLLSGPQPGLVLPGGVFPVISALIMSRLIRKEWPEIVRTLRAYLSSSNDVRVWQELVSFIPYLHPGTLDERPSLIRDVFASVPELAGTSGGALVINYAHWYAPNTVMSELDRWKQSPSNMARKGYGELIALIALVNPTVEGALDRMNEIIADPLLEEARAGAAMTAAQLWSDVKHRSTACDFLVRMLDSNERSVWHAVFAIFSLVEELHPEEETVKLLRAIAANLARAPSPEDTRVVESLATLLPHEAPLVATIAASLVLLWREQLGDIRTAKAVASADLLNLALTLHRIGPVTRGAGLEMFEHLLEIDAYQSREMLATIDNRFDKQAPIGRQRLRRKHRRRAI